jgi:regulator of sigma E protease
MMGEDDDDVSEGSFNSKSVWARMSVIAAGPVFNFILAFILSAIVVAWLGFDPPVISDVTDGYPAQEAGLQGGDEIVQINNKHINIYREITVYLQFHAGEELNITYVRDGEKYTTDLTPKYDEEEGRYMLGVYGPTSYSKANVFQDIQYGVYEVKYWICTTVSSLKQLVTGAVGLDQMSGPVGIVNYVDDTYDASKSAGIAVIVLNLMNIAILLTANLGVMNLLPIPALDGGRLVFLIVEAIRGKRVPPEKEGIVHLIGFALLMLLMVVVMFNDIRTIITG